MTVIADYTVAARALALGRAAAEGTQVELVQLLDSGPAPLAYFWTWGGSEESFERALAEQEAVEGLRLVDDAADRQLYRGEYRLAGDTLLKGIVEYDGVVLEAQGDGEEWEMLLRFPDSDAFREFQRTAVDEEVATVDSVYGGADPARSTNTELTRRQRETLITAYRQGYFDIPRKITLVDLAEELGISDQAVSERLRRGEAKLVGSQLFDD